jgi:hypothetical protein
MLPQYADGRISPANRAWEKPVQFESPSSRDPSRDPSAACDKALNRQSEDQEPSLNPHRLSPLYLEHTKMPNDDSRRLGRLRDALLDHPLYTDVVSIGDLRRFMEDHVFAVWDFMSLLKRLQQDLTCTRVPWLPANNAKAARLINDIVIGEETDADPDGFYVSHLELYLRAMQDVGASTVQFDTFCSMVRAGFPVEVVLTRIGVARHVHAFVGHTMALANTGTTEEVLAAFFYGREDIIPEMFHRLLKTLHGAKHDNRDLRHFIYYIDRHIELDADSHGPKGKELLKDLVESSPDKAERATRAACSSIEARIVLWNGTLSKLHDSRNAKSPVEA